MDTPTYRLTLDASLEPSPVRPALIWGEELEADAANQPALLVETLEAVASLGEEAIPADVRRRVRAMLRFGKYKPSGRGKPASEFLLRAALSGEFPRINGPVDVNNAISLASGFPASIFDRDRTGSALWLRRGRPGESYVFNPSGQEIDLEDLLLVCCRGGEEWLPCGNPVKDSMATKTSAATRNVVAVLYAPADEPPESIRSWADRFADLLRNSCGAKRVGVVLAG